MMLSSTAKKKSSQQQSRLASPWTTWRTSNGTHGTF
jgi:hypothetical protein